MVSVPTVIVGTLARKSSIYFKTTSFLKSLPDCRKDKIF
ncbi:MAG: hypothetical protein ACI81W_004217 [Saprospiraceae bacterium]